jgi:hypothetical protein
VKQVKEIFNYYIFFTPHTTTTIFTKGGEIMGDYGGYGDESYVFIIFLILILLLAGGHDY